MSAFGHAGFGSSNRRNQLRAQGQIGADTYGQGVRNAMQAPTLNIYNAPQTYQQATGQPTAAPQTGNAQTNQPSAPVSQPQPPVYQTDDEPPNMQTYSPPPSPGRAQPIQSQSQGTPYGNQDNPEIMASAPIPAPAVAMESDYQVRAGGRMSAEELRAARALAAQQRADADRLHAARAREEDLAHAASKRPSPGGAASPHYQQLAIENLVRQQMGEEWYAQNVTDPRRAILEQNATKIQNLAGYL